MQYVRRALLTPVQEATISSPKPITADSPQRRHVYFDDSSLAVVGRPIPRLSDKSTRVATADSLACEGVSFSTHEKVYYKQSRVASADSSPSYSPGSSICSFDGDSEGYDLGNVRLEGSGELSADEEAQLNRSPVRVT
ncbi:hypothetical protein DID76_04655 [Candidatus Marinamargulisbacteria bacterium SCGC AG-414-C22]|nr:hypothetical protein DID76_04655 [Candidatus Marinamargulisbacteria bacterium SCGC AG-414-C22]